MIQYLNDPNSIKKHGKSFYWASFFLPKRNKKIASELYSICRFFDDLADENDDDQTKWLSEEFKKINNSAMLINVGRGNAVNEKDLAEALNSGILAAAALDTTKNEPLEKSSDLWSAKNCFISAHDSAHSLLGLPRAFELFLENVKNFKGNQPIKNLYR